MWVLVPRGRGTKTEELSMHFCFGCIIGQKGQVCWWSLPKPHQGGKGFTHLPWQLKTPHCRKQEGSDSTHKDRKCSLAKQGRIWLLKSPWGEWTITLAKNEPLCEEHWYYNSSLGVCSHLPALCSGLGYIYTLICSPAHSSTTYRCSLWQQFFIIVVWSGS